MGITETKRTIALTRNCLIERVSFTAYLLCVNDFLDFDLEILVGNGKSEVLPSGRVNTLFIMVATRLLKDFGKKCMYAIKAAEDNNPHRYILIAL